MDKDPPEYVSDLPTLGDLTVRDVLALDESVLSHALQRLQHEADHPEEASAGWGSAI